MRAGMMIIAGVAAVQKFRWMTLLFAGILFLSAIKLLLEGDDDDEDEINDVIGDADRADPQWRGRRV